MSVPNDYKHGKYDKPITYAVKHKDESTRMASRSGGIFTALSDKVLKDGGIVYGCALDESLSAVHIRAVSKEDRDRMRGSKYIQSEMKDMFAAVKRDLEDGKKVLFSGTSCQVAGLRGFLVKEYDELLCVDIVCHGVPSPMVWKEYLRWLEGKKHSKVKAVDFRNKKRYGWRAHVETLHLAKGKEIDSRVFTTLFYGHMILRPSCYRCPYKDIIHPGDITIADYWGIDEAVPGFNDNKGVSLVLVNNDRGRAVLEAVQENLTIVKTRIEDSMQPPLEAPFKSPEKRDQFWSDHSTMKFGKIAKEYGGYGIMNKIKRKIRHMMGKDKNSSR